MNDIGISPHYVYGSCKVTCGHGRNTDLRKNDDQRMVIITKYIY